MKRIIILALALSACASQPVEAQLATACNQLATAYREAAVLRANGKLSDSAIGAINDVTPGVVAACDPDHPPANINLAVANALTALQTITLQTAGVK